MPRVRAPRRPLPSLRPPRAPASCILLALELLTTPADTFSLANSGEHFSADPPPLLQQSGATGPRVSTVRPPPPPSPPSRGSSSPFRLSWSSSFSSSSMAQPSGCWRGSYMREDDIERLVRLRRIPSTVITRAPDAEIEPKPEPGERVVFGAHFDHRLGLPASNFFRQFLDYFGLQPHHLSANACVLLICYVAFMEAYAGLWPDIDFWSRLFFIKAQTTDGHLRTCGAASIYSRPGTPFPKIPTVDSVKNWQMSFFYVRNENLGFDRINLPEYNPAPPVGRINWGYNARTTDPDTELRTHKIGHMSGRFDPTRTSKAELSKAQVARRVNNITKANMPEAWNYGLVPYSRESPPELVTFDSQNVEDGDLAQREWTPDHADPADQAGDQAGDDDLPQAPDQGGQGEHNPPPSPEQEEEDEPATSTTGPILRCLCARGRLAPRRLRRPRGRSGSATAPPPPWRRR
ncbi:hypothetical protein QYE76_043269 [Lolium multiflorum]|uniref:Transposase (putative) gypsy type domain-containing protein n=1 Tax=Lolium multiflorum TaxID=4521 RepID=A0AAD8TIT5_LOLMU|nr:hypothetical protein QYE76_043269 [Lolium multiflorum]